jgi:hypothetical protein
VLNACRLRGRTHIVGRKPFNHGPHFLLNYLLTQTGTTHWSNLPLFPEKIAAEAAKRTGQPVEEFINRIKLVPPEVCDSWRAGTSGPWEFFAEIDLQDAHLALDEFHEFCGATTKPELREKYRVWFGQIRHRGATIEIISQDPDKIGREVERECASRLSLVNNEDRRDPYFKILFGDWYELRAKFITGQYLSSVWEIEYRKVNGKWVEEDKRVFWLDKNYFGFYDSYSKPTDSKVKGEAKKREFEKRSHLGLLWWFTRNNWPRLAWKGAIFAGVAWLVFGGLPWLMLKTVGLMQRRVTSAMTKAAAGDLGNGNILHKPRAAAVPAQKEQPATLPVGVIGEGVIVRRKEVASLPVPVSEPSATTMPTDRLTIANRQASEYYAQLQEERNKTIELENKLAESEQKLRAAAAVVCLTPDTMTLSDGQSYRVGERIDSGMYQGKCIKAIHWERRRVEFDDGTVIGLGTQSQSSPVRAVSLPGPAASEPAPASASVPGAVRGAR